MIMLRLKSSHTPQGLNHWKSFYAEHKDYFKVGRVVHPPIDPVTPIPVHCDPKKAAKQAEARKKKKDDATTGSKAEDGTRSSHNEL